MHSNFRMTISSALNITFIALLFSLYFFVASVQQKMVQTTATLTYSRYAFAATSLGELVFFGGGSNDFNLFNLVDICNVTSGSWTTATLSTSRVWLAATSLVNLVFFLEVSVEYIIIKWISTTYQMEIGAVQLSVKRDIC
jgi:hypothetical protein